MSSRTLLHSSALLILLLTGCTVANPARYYSRAEAKMPYDALIVPGMPYTDEGGVHIGLKARLVWAVHLYRKGFAKRLIMSGAAVYTPYSEARIMREYAVAMGVPREHIILDECAEHSTENMYYGYQMACAAGLRDVALASDEFQVKMLKPMRRRMKRELGVHIDLLPLVRDSVSDLFAATNPDFDPKVALVPDFVSIVERESFWRRFRGTLGRHIPWEDADQCTPAQAVR
ncbi:MAG: YdcF family protein [Flavobacteriales bacterium]|jgi:hypothetical protein|nr:YdcF family protein [Flavobacteriales bacterium]